MITQDEIAERLRRLESSYRERARNYAIYPAEKIKFENCARTARLISEHLDGVKQYPLG